MSDRYQQLVKQGNLTSGEARAIRKADSYRDKPGAVRLGLIYLYNLGQSITRNAETECRNPYLSLFLLALMIYGVAFAKAVYEGHEYNREQAAEELR